MIDENQQDGELIKAIRQGNKLAFRQLFDKYYQRLLGTGLHLLKDENAAKDAVQDVFFQIWKNRSTLNISSSVFGYLKRATINRSLNQIKSRKPFVEEEKISGNSSTAPSPIQLLEASDLQSAVQQGLESLPERCRTIFILKRIEGYSVKEIAAKLEISPKTVENQITKAIKVLKDRVAPIMKKDSS